MMIVDCSAYGPGSGVKPKRYGDDDPPWTAEPDVTPASHPDHHTVGHEFMGRGDLGEGAVRYFCESHDCQGYWLYATDGSGRWRGVSERAIGATFHLIHKDPDGRVWSGFSRVPSYDPVVEMTDAEREGILRAIESDHICASLNKRT